METYTSALTNTSEYIDPTGWPMQYWQDVNKINSAVSTKAFRTVAWPIRGIATKNLVHQALVPASLAPVALYQIVQRFDIVLLEVSAEFHVTPHVKVPAILFLNGTHVSVAPFLA
jgi:hypothetical protein